MAAVVGLTWPLLTVRCFGPGAIELWTTHVTGRLIGHSGRSLFAGEEWWEYIVALLAQALPWTPFSFIGAWSSLTSCCPRLRQ